MQNTTNYNLKKPENNEFVNVDDINGNMDIIDEQLKNIDDSKVTKIIGKGLSTNDYTTPEKEKLATLSNYDDSGLRQEISTKTDKTTVYTKQETDTKLTEQQTYTDTKLSEKTGINATATYTNNAVTITAPVSVQQITFIAPSDFIDSDTYTLNGTQITITDLNNEPLSNAWKQGSPVQLIIKGNKAFFKSGGGANDTLPPQIRSFAVTSGNAQNKLSWLLPVDTSAYEGLVIIKKVGSAPIKVSDGTKIQLSKTATSYTDTELTNDVTYYYRAFPYNSKKQYQTDIVGAVAYGTPKAFDPIFANNSWAMIDAVSRSGNIPSTWKVGDTKDITLTSGETLTMQIYGFKHDDLADGSGKAGITMGMRHLLEFPQVMNNTPTNVGGYPASVMFTYLDGPLVVSLPHDLKPYVKMVNKKTSAGDNSATINTNPMRLFSFSEIEVWGGTKGSFSGEGSPYSIVSVGGVDNRIKKLNNGNGAAKNWWLRSPRYGTSTNFCCILPNGETHSDYANTSYGVCFGFCI